MEIVFWLFFTFILGMGIFKSISKKLDVFDDDFPSVRPDGEKGSGPESDKGQQPEQAKSAEPVLVQEAKPVQVQEAKPVLVPGSKAGPVLKPKAAPERLFGLIGKPLGHSKSEVLFKTRFRQQHISADYRNFELESIDELPEMIAANPNLCGFNVTIPYKEAVIPFLDSLDESASAVGAVNAVKVIRTRESVRLVGYNTDCQGFLDSIKDHIGDRRKALILGTGGAAKAVKHAFDLLGVESRFVSRSSTFDIMGYYELSPSILEEYTIIVNCTPVGMFPNVDQCPDIPYSFISSEHLLYDVINNPDQTLFMKKGLERGASVIGGKDMFELQAAASWRIWNS